MPSKEARNLSKTLPNPATGPHSRGGLGSELDENARN